MTIPIEKVRKANLANIMKKAAKGQTLTASDLRILEEEERRLNGLREDRTEEQMAKEYNVSMSTIKRWKRDKAPFENDADLNAWVVAKQRPPKKFEKWQREKGFLEDTQSAGKMPENFTSQEDILNYYQKKLSAAASAENAGQVKLWNDLLLKTAESIRRSEAHAAKLGIDKGTLLSREEVERILRAVIYAGNACIQGVLTSICETLAGKSDPAEIYHFLKPQIVGGRLFSGFDRVKDLPGAPGLPGWVVECVKVEEEEYLR